MIKNNRNNEQIYGRNDMIMLDQNNKIYGSLGLADKYVMKTEEGTRLVLNNPKVGKFGDVLTEFNMYGRSEQLSTTGAQLFNKNIEIKNRGVNIKINGSTATFDGIVSDEINSRVNYQGDIKLKPGKYIASSSNKKIVADFIVTKANDETIYNNRIEIDGTEKAVKIRVLFGLKPSAKGDVIHETTNIMLNDGDVALPYEPYTGGKPSPNPDYPQEIKRVVNPVVKVCGKNLWDNFKTLSLGNVEQKNGTYIATADNMQVDITMESVGARPLLLKANNAYTFSLKTTVSISSFKFVCLRYTNGETNNVVFTNKNFVNFVPKRDVEKVGFILYESVAGDKVYDVQLEMGSEATPYEPYYEEQTVVLPYTLNAIPVSSGGNYTDQSGQQWICDEVDLARGVKVQRIKVKELSPDGWAYRKLASGNNNFQVRIFNADVAIDGKPCFCNILPFKNVLWSDNIQNLPKIYANNQEITASFPPNSEYSSLEAFKQLLMDVKSVIYYILATPIETALTHAEIAAYKALSTKIPTTIIENNYSTWMKATYKSTESV